MKITIGGKWEIEILPDSIYDELEEKINETQRLTNEIDQKVKDQKYGNDTDRSSRSSH